MLLTLPALASKIPAVLEFGNCGEHHFRLALAMSRVGMFSDAALSKLRSPQIKGSGLIQLIDSVWMREIGPLFDFKVISAKASLLIPSNTGNFIGPMGEPQCAIVFNADYPNVYQVGAVMDALETQNTGLGCTALSVIDFTISQFGIAFTPSGALEMASHLYWQGDDEETTVLQQYEEEEVSIDDLVTREKIFHGIPEWAYDCKARASLKLPAEDFARIAGEMSGTAFGPFLAHIVRINNLLENPACWPDVPEDFPCTEPMVVLRWRGEDDNLLAVFDDYFEYESQGEQAPYTGSIIFQLTEHDLSNALMRVRHTAKTLRALDDALFALDTLNECPRIPLPGPTGSPANL